MKKIVDNKALALNPDLQKYVKELKNPWSSRLPIVIRPIVPEDEAIIRHPHITRKNAKSMCNIDYGKEMTFVMVCRELLMGIVEIKKNGRDFSGKLTHCMSDDDVIAFTQKHLLDAMVGYVNDEG